jgi:hypothetical protein
MAFADAAMRNARRVLGQLRAGPGQSVEAPEGNAERAGSDRGETPGEWLDPSPEPVDLVGG